MNRQKRNELIYKISDILDQCETCSFKRGMLDAGPYNASVPSKIQKNCIRVCEEGKKLQALGIQLGNKEIERGGE